MAKGILDTSTLLLLPRLADTERLPEEPLITTITLAELSAGPLVATSEAERAARQAHLQQAEADFVPLPFDAAAARITRDTVLPVADVSIRDLRNHGGEIVERAERGERLTITRAGTPVAELTALPRAPIGLEVLRERRAHLPHVDSQRLRDDIDAVIEPSV